MLLLERQFLNKLASILFAIYTVLAVLSLCFLQHDIIAARLLLFIRAITYCLLGAILKRTLSQECLLINELYVFTHIPD